VVVGKLSVIVDGVRHSLTKGFFFGRRGNTRALLIYGGKMAAVSTRNIKSNVPVVITVTITE